MPNKDVFTILVKYWPHLRKTGHVGVTMAAKPKRPRIKVAQYDSADYLKSEADIKNYLAAVFEEPMDREMLIHTLGVVARARGMMKLAGDTGITRARGKSSSDHI
jgi:hypothetical protein